MQFSLKEAGLKRLLLFSSTIVIITITSIVSYFLIVIESRNFQQEIQKIENELIDNKKRYLENRLKTIIDEVSFNQTLIEKFELEKVEDLVVAMSQTLEVVSDKNPKKIKAILSHYNSGEKINCFSFYSDGTLFWSPNSPESEGNNYLDVEDIDGNAYIQTMIHKAKNHDMTPTSYMWYVPNQSIISKNIAYVRYVSHLDIVVGAYISQKSIEQAIENTMFEKIYNLKFDGDSFFFIDFIDSYNMSGQFSSELISLGNVKSLEVLKKRDTFQKVGELFLQKGFDKIVSHTIEHEDSSYLVYASVLKEYRWLIVVGENLKELYRTKVAKKQLSEQNLNLKITNLILISVIVAFLFFVFSIFLVKKIEKLLIDYQRRADTESNKYQALYQHSNDSFLLANSNFKIIDANPKSSTLTNLEKSELLETSLPLFFPQIDFQTIKIQSSGFYRTPFVDYFGHEKTVEFSFVWIEIESEKIVFASIRDITERMKLINERREYEQILIQQSKMAAMGEMIGNIAHQWRQPLSQISGLFMDIASAYSYKELDKKYLDGVIDEADDIIEYMSRTIDDFRNFFNPNKTKEEFLASSALEQAIKIVKSSFEFHEIKLEIDIKDEKPIFGYKNEYSQVILNILSNAKDILLERKTPHPLVFIVLEYQDHTTRLSIGDNAGGVEQEMLEKIFEPYFTTKYDYGTGIGLYMSKAIIEKNMNGTIEVYNTSIGAQFVIST